MRYENDCIDLDKSINLSKDVLKSDLISYSSNAHVSIYLGLVFIVLISQSY